VLRHALSSQMSSVDPKKSFRQEKVFCARMKTSQSRGMMIGGAILIVMGLTLPLLAWFSGPDSFLGLGGIIIWCIVGLLFVWRGGKLFMMQHTTPNKKSCSSERAGCAHVRVRAFLAARH